MRRGGPNESNGRELLLSGCSSRGRRWGWCVAHVGGRVVSSKRALRPSRATLPPLVHAHTRRLFQKANKKCSLSAPPVSCVFDSRECPPPRARRLCYLCLKATFGCCWFCLTCDTGHSRGALTTPTSQADKWHETQMWQGPRGPGSDTSGSGMGSHV